MFVPLIERAGDEEISRLFSEQSLVAVWLEVEQALALAQAELSVIPQTAAEAIVTAAVPAHIDLVRLRENTSVVGYPILPLLEQIAEASPDAGRYVHWGATTQDVMDCGLALIASQALDRMHVLARELGDALAIAADRHRSTVMPGRTHAQPAVPITFGLKVAVWLSELTRHAERLRSARERIGVVQLFGAAGTAAALGDRSHEVRGLLAQRLGLRVVDVPWHTARDAIAETGFVLAALAATCGKLAHEVVELSRPEIGELHEAAGRHRGASSTMPQKSNPVGSELVIALSALAGQNAGALLLALQGTHERAAGEWQIEWDALPLVFATASGAVAESRRIVDGLSVFPERMRENLDAEGGSIMAESVMMALADLVGRSAAHDLVYEASTLARRQGIPLEEALRTTLDRDLLARLGPLEKLLDPHSYLGEANRIITVALDRWKGVTTALGEVAGTARP